MSWAFLGAILDCLGLSRALFDSLGVSWDSLGALLADLGALLGALGALWGSLGRLGAFLGPSNPVKSTGKYINQSLIVQSPMIFAKKSVRGFRDMTDS